MTKGATRRSRAGQAGYSLIELMVVVGIMAVLSGMAIAQFAMTRSALRGDAAMRLVLSRLNAAREMAITQRRYMRVTFDTTLHQLVIVREDTVATTTNLSASIFESGGRFMVTPSVPDTPDAFGNSKPTCFTSQNGTFESLAGNASIAKFAPDGTLVDWNGRTTNGTVFTGIPNTPTAARAITILGSTGRVRGYRWDGRQWVKV